MSITPLDCSKCNGACCRSLPNIDNEEIQALLTPSGICINLSCDNKCKIYDTRPAFCRSDVMYEVYKAQYGLTEEQYRDIQHKACKYLQETNKDRE